MRCPECDAGLPEGAVLCVNCGYHLEKGKRLKTRHGKRAPGVAWDADLDWNPRFGRVTVGIGLQAGLVVTAALLACFGRGPDGVRIEWVILGFLLGTLLIWTLVGTFTRVRLARDHKGAPILVLFRRLLFIPRGQTVYPLARYKAVYTDYAVAQGKSRAEYYRLYLGGEYRDDMPLVLILFTTNDDKMRELCDVLKEAANLSINRL